jgi:hypothetical protein
MEELNTTNPFRAAALSVKLGLVIDGRERQVRHYACLRNSL